VPATIVDMAPMPGRHNAPTAVNILFVHQNFPAQFRWLAPELARRGHRVRATTPQQPEAAAWEGVQLVPYTLPRSSTPGVHPWLQSLESKAIRGEACFHAANRLRAEGFTPDVIVAHPGWGESLFLKDVWPRARLGIYCEYYYRAEGADVGFDPEFPAAETEPCRLRLTNANLLMHFDVADAGIAPTRWQASTFPEPFRSRISVVHDGIDTATVAPAPQAQLALSRAGTLRRGDEVVTFVARTLEPYRGFHVFMRALREILRRRPRARVLIVGGSDEGYGKPPADGTSWRQRLVREVRPSIPDADWQRVHFLGSLPYAQYLAVLQLSAVHVYLSYPFVLSWSLLEAMSAGCAVVASDTAPLHEMVRHGETGRLVGFFDTAGLADEVSGLLDDTALRQRLGDAARRFVRANHDRQTVCLPAQLAWVEALAGGAPLPLVRPSPA
jgi:glycosyltransferase involved in cell wall biosynthesis